MQKIQPNLIVIIKTLKENIEYIEYINGNIDYHYIHKRKRKRVYLDQCIQQKLRKTPKFKKMFTKFIVSSELN